jgi:heterotetrameric sarcosine oxidase delta subunit
MSIRITCPHCGERPVQEFVYGEVLSPPAGLADREALNLDRAFMRTNPEGVTHERWFHSYGCRRWFGVRRDTRTDRMVQDGG